MWMLIELLLSLAAILAAATLFTNAIEILGARLAMGQGAVGSILAAVGTALPETIIPVVALLGALVLGRDLQTAGEISIGAILGAPFLLATLAMFVVGLSTLGFRGRRVNKAALSINRDIARHDLGFFLPCFAAAAVAGIIVLPFYLKVLLAAALLAAYAYYVWGHLKREEEALWEVPENLQLWPFNSEPPTWAVAGQILMALTVMVAGAHFFVDALEHGSRALGVPAGLFALLLAPLATELPEKFNSVIWIRAGKDMLALGNVTGAMVFQSTIPVTVGILFTRWKLDFFSIFSVVLTLISGTTLYFLLRRNQPLQVSHLLGCGALYAIFVTTACLALLSGQ